MKTDWHVLAISGKLGDQNWLFIKESSYFSAQGKGSVSRKLTGLLTLLMPKLWQMPLAFLCKHRSRYVMHLCDYIENQLA